MIQSIVRSTQKTLRKSNNETLEDQNLQNYSLEKYKMLTLKVQNLK